MKIGPLTHALALYNDACRSSMQIGRYQWLRDRSQGRRWRKWDRAMRRSEERATRLGKQVMAKIVDLAS